MTPGGRGLQFVSYIHMHRRIQCSNRKKNLSKKVISYLLLWHFKTPTALPKDTNTFDIIPYVPFFVALIFFFLNLFLSFIYCFTVQCRKSLTKFHRPKMCKLVLSLYSNVGILFEISPEITYLHTWKMHAWGFFYVRKSRKTSNKNRLNIYIYIYTR